MAVSPEFARAQNTSRKDRGWFAREILRGIGAPISGENQRAMLAWMEGENTKAQNNPLATTLPGYGGTKFNESKVKNYPTPEEGVAATIATLNLSHYTSVVAALQKGTNPAELRGLVVATPWGTEHFGTGKNATTPLGQGSNFTGLPDGDGGFETAEEMDAWELVRSKLKDYGLESLEGEVRTYITQGLSPEAAILRIEDTDTFKQRFPGLQLRKDNGYKPITPYDYVSLERTYKNVMVQAGLPEGFYDQPEDFTQFIANDVMPTEFQERVDNAYAAVNSVNPYLKEQLRDMYGVGVENEGELVAYFLDPERGMTAIEQRLQLEAAGLSAQAKQTLGSSTGLSDKTAEQLTELGVAQREISERLKGKGSLTQSLTGTRGLSSSELAAAEFGMDSEAVANLRRLRQEREGMTRKASGAALSAAGVVGLGRVR